VTSAILSVILFLLVVLPAGEAADTDYFDRFELYVDGPVDDVLVGDADRDGLRDVFVLYHQELPGGTQHRTAFFRQNRHGQFPNTLKQSWALPDNSGLVDLAEVTGDSIPELVMLTSQGAFSFLLYGSQFSEVIEPVISLARPIHLPPASVKAWDFCWPLYGEQQEVVALPRLTHLELWSPDQNGVYVPAESLWCQSLITVPVEASTYGTVGEGEVGMSICLPSFLGSDSRGAREFFLSSRGGVKHFRRNDQAGLQISEGPEILNQRSSAPLFPRGPFGDHIVSGDLSGDGALDLVRCRTMGGVTDARTEVEVHLGPLASEGEPHMNQRLVVDNTISYLQLADLDGDSRKDIVICAIELGTISSAKMIVVKSINLYLLAYQQRPDHSFNPDADERLKIPIDLKTSVPHLLEGIPVRFVGDIDGDDRDDFVSLPGEDYLDVYLAQEGRLLPREETFRLDCDSPRDVFSEDLNGDRKADLIIQHNEKPLQVHKVTVFLTK